MSTTYLSVTTSISAHRMHETAPIRCGSSSGTPVAGAKISLTVYSGLVPMSPYTTPRAPSVSAARAAGVLGAFAGTYKPLHPQPEYAAFVERCLKEKGYETGGWQ